MSDEPYEPEEGDILSSGFLNKAGYQNMQAGNPASMQMSLRKMDMRLMQVEKKNKAIEETLKRINETLILMRTVEAALALDIALTNPLATSGAVGIAGANFAMGSVSSAIVVGETT